MKVGAVSQWADVPQSRLRLGSPNITFQNDTCIQLRKKGFTLSWQVKMSRHMFCWGLGFRGPRRGHAHAVLGAGPKQPQLHSRFCSITNVSFK